MEHTLAAKSSATAANEIVSAGATGGMGEIENEIAREIAGAKAGAGTKTAMAGKAAGTKAIAGKAATGKAITGTVAGTKTAAGKAVAGKAVAGKAAAGMGAGGKFAAGMAGGTSASGAKTVTGGGTLLAGKGLGLGLGIAAWGMIAVGALGALAIYGYIRNSRAGSAPSDEELELNEALAEGEAIT